MDATILREAWRRLSRAGGKGTPSDYGYCRICGQNERHNHGQVLEVLLAIANHAEGVNHTRSGGYDGVYFNGSN